MSHNLPGDLPKTNNGSAGRPNDPSIVAVRGVDGGPLSPSTKPAAPVAALGLDLHEINSRASESQCAAGSDSRSQEQAGGRTEAHSSDGPPLTYSDDSLESLRAANDKAARIFAKAGTHADICPGAPDCCHEDDATAPCSICGDSVPVDPDYSDEVPVCHEPECVAAAHRGENHGTKCECSDCRNEGSQS